jgi:large subunit ribosomal protein L4
MNQRRGLTSTKTRGEVSGGGRKPWRQKGTGRARVGSTRSPLWRHGGVVFGPHPRHFSYSVSHKLRRLALKSGLNAKVKEDSLVVLDTLSMEKPKTKEAAKIFKNLRVVSNKPKHALLLVDKKQKNLDLAVRNISFLDVNLAQNTNVYEVLAHAKLLVTREGLKQLIGRLKQ